MTGAVSVAQIDKNGKAKAQKSFWKRIVGNYAILDAAFVVFVGHQRKYINTNI